jgi:signal peptidase complex subunit 3
MHTATNRANAVLTFFGTVAAALCVLVTLTDLLHTSDPPVSLTLTPEATKLSLHRGRQDQAGLALALDADLRSAFSWNTKQLFVYVQSEYATPDNAVNQVVLWDRIVTRQRDAHLRVKALRLKYPFIDRGRALRGRAFNVTVVWDVMPKVGRLAMRSRSFPMPPLPEEYTA